MLVLRQTLSSLVWVTGSRVSTADIVVLESCLSVLTCVEAPSGKMQKLSFVMPNSEPIQGRKRARAFSCNTERQEHKALPNV
jgi:hypothetical protein